MNKPQEIPEYIFDFIAEKTFEELAATEKKKVQKYMSEEDYRENRILIGDFQDVNSQLQFDADSPVRKTEKSLDQSKGGFAFSLLQMAATVVILISLGIGFGQLINPEQKALPVTAEEDGIRAIEVGAPNYVNVTPVNIQATEVQLQRIERVAEQVSEEKGTSLEEDDYPAELILSI